MESSTWTSGCDPVIGRNEVRIVDQKLVSIGRFADDGKRLGGSGRGVFMCYQFHAHAFYCEGRKNVSIQLGDDLSLMHRAPSPALALLDAAEAT